MSKAYCKSVPPPLPPLPTQDPITNLPSSLFRWPVIIGIIVISVILISILWCCARCLCCGLSCCCDCFSCCGGGRRNRQPKYADPPPPPQPFQPAPYQGYQPPPHMPLQNQGYNPTPDQQPLYGPPQFAQFDVSRKPQHVNEDALPAMPSWETATSKKVLEEHDGEMEMGTLEPAQAQQVPMLRSPSTEYAHPSTHALENSYQQQQQPPHAQAELYAPQTQQHYPNPNPYTDHPPQPSYSAYAPSPSASTRYAPSSTAYELQETGVTYASARSPPPQQQQYHPQSPPPQHQYQQQQQQYAGNAPAPSILQAGRKPVPNTWQDV